MKVEYLFSNRPKSLFSKMISWASGYEGLSLSEYPSHMAVLLNDTVVVESTLLTGVRMIPYSHWKKKNNEIYKIPCTKDYRSSQEVLDKAFTKWGKRYDWIGISYFAWRFLGLIILQRPLPAHNHWQDKDKYFCCEYAGTLADQNFSMKSPARICNDWLEASK